MIKFIRPLIATKGQHKNRQKQQCYFTVITCNINNKEIRNINDSDGDDADDDDDDDDE